MPRRGSAPAPTDMSMTAEDCIPSQKPQTTANTTKMTGKPRRTYLYEVAAIRTFAISAIFIVHSFAIFSGGWQIDQPLPDIPGFRMVPVLLSAFRVQALVFVAGYVYAFQRIELHRDGAENPQAFLAKKGKRLLVPWLFFGALYLLIFGNVQGMSYLWNFVTGPGHLWFLPMLFILYAGALVIAVYGIRFHWCWVPVYGALYLTSLFLPNVLNAPNAVQYGLYFFMGYVVYTHRATFMSLCKLRAFRACLTAAFLAWFALTYFYGDSLITALLPGQIGKGLLLGNKTALSVFGIMALYSNVLNWVSHSPKAQESRVLNNINRYSYGLYVYHQFVMMAMLRLVCLPHGIDLALVPFVLLASSVIGAGMLTLLTLQTRAGRALLG